MRNNPVQSPLTGRWSPEAPRPDEMPAEETPQVPVRDERAGAGRVDESAATHVDADVIDAMRADPEEQKVAREQVAHRYGLRRSLLLRRRPRNGDASPLVHVHGEAAAIEPAAVRSAESIRGSDETLRDGGNVPSGFGAGYGRASSLESRQRGESHERPESRQRLKPRS